MGEKSFEINVVPYKHLMCRFKLGIANSNVKSFWIKLTNCTIFRYYLKVK